MKGFALFLAATAFASLAAVGQGQFVFNNRVLPDVNARFISFTDPASGAVSSIGTDYSVQLFSAAGGSLTPLDPPSTTFRGAAGTAAAGYVTPTTETVLGVAPGASANVVIRVIGPGLGGNWTYGPYTVALGGGTITPPNLPLGTTPLIVGIPEPSVLLLGWIGGGVLLLARRAVRGSGSARL